MPALLVLAAGESSRMRFPKALLTLNGETFVESILHKANDLGFDPVLIVTGPDHEAIARHVSDKMVCIKNENHLRGQISSLQKGILTLKNSVPGVMIWPVDQPLVKKETVRKILQSYEEYRQALTIPVYRGSKGHPVLYDRRAMDATLALESQQTGKDLQTIFATQTTLVEVEDPGIVMDIDTPEDYEKYVKSLNRDY